MLKGIFLFYHKQMYVGLNIFYFTTYIRTYNR